MLSRRTNKLRILLSSIWLMLEACSGSTFSGSGSKAPEAQKKTDSASTDATAAKGPEGKSVGRDVANREDPSDKPNPTAEATAKGKENNKDQPGDGTPTDGVESDLTVTIFDTDSKMDVFRVKNEKSQDWLPLTWVKGAQTVKRACSPKTPTALTLELHAAAGFFTPAASLVPGSCNAPLTQTAPNTVDMGVDRTCSGQVKAHATFQCSGSSDLKILK